VFFGLAVDEKLPENVKPGDMLIGQSSFGEPSVTPFGKYSRGGFLLQYVVMATKGKEKEKDEKEEDTRSVAEKSAEAVRDARLKTLETCREWSMRSEYEAQLLELVESYPKHLPILQENIKFAEMQNPDEDSAKEEETYTMHRIVDACDLLVRSVDQDELAAHLGRRVDEDDLAAVRESKEWGKRKDALVDALSKKISTLVKMEGEGIASDLQSSFKALASWVDVTEAKHGCVVSAYEKANGRFATALSALNKHIQDEKVVSRTLLEERACLLEKLGWHEWSAHEHKSLIVKFPKEYARF
jgi:hypothetical protein